MDNEISLKGFVLNDQPIGEYDKRVSLLTLERGRVSAFLRGAKRGKGSPLAAILPFSFGEFYLYEGKNSYTIHKADITERFTGITSDLTNLAYGSYFLDVAGYYSRENNNERDRIKLIYQSLRALSNDNYKKELVRYIYELKNIAIMGEYPNIFGCDSCGAQEKITAFSFDKRVSYCEDCAKKITGLYPLSTTLAYTLWFIFTTPIEKLYSFKLSDASFLELKSFCEKYKARYFKHPFKTLEMLSVLVDV